jgi:hypothetical protein
MKCEKLALRCLPTRTVEICERNDSAVFQTVPINESKKETGASLFFVL